MGRAGLHRLAVVGVGKDLRHQGAGRPGLDAREPRPGDGGVDRRAACRGRRDHGRSHRVRGATRVLLPARQSRRRDHAAGDPGRRRPADPMDGRVRGGRRRTDVHRGRPRAQERLRRVRPPTRRGRRAERPARSGRARPCRCRRNPDAVDTHTRTHAENPRQHQRRHPRPSSHPSRGRRQKAMATGRGSPGAATGTETRSAGPTGGNGAAPPRSRSDSVEGR